MSKKNTRAKTLIQCPNCQGFFMSNERFPECPFCKTSLKVVETNPYVVVKIHRRKKKKGQ